MARLSPSRGFQRDWLDLTATKIDGTPNRLTLSVLPHIL